MTFTRRATVRQLILQDLCYLLHLQRSSDSVREQVIFTHASL